MTDESKPEESAVPPVPPAPTAPEATPAGPPAPPAPPAAAQPNPYASQQPNPYAAQQQPQYTQQPQYGAGQPQYGQQAYVAGQVGPRTNVLAIVSLVASIAGAFILPFVGSIAGVIMGHIAQGQIKRTGEGGKGLATAGLIVGYIGLALWVIGVILFIVVIALAAGSSSYYNDF